MRATRFGWSHLFAVADLWEGQLWSKGFGGGIVAVAEPSPDLMDMRHCTETWQFGFALKAWVMACSQISRGKCISRCRWCQNSSLNNSLLLLTMALADWHWEGKGQQSPEVTAVQARQAQTQMADVYLAVTSLLLLCLYFVSAINPARSCGWLCCCSEENSRFHSFKPNLNLAKKTQSNADQAYQSLGLAFTFHAGSKNLNKYQLLEISDIAGEVFQVAGGTEVNQNPVHMLEPRG